MNPELALAFGVGSSFAITLPSFASSPKRAYFATGLIDDIAFEYGEAKPVFLHIEGRENRGYVRFLWSLCGGTRVVVTLLRDEK